ncbi:hypothetical protein GC176_15710 [bacterium]|nr:hypothetical protein [bacterium]
MTRIFLTLAFLGTALIAVTFFLGLGIDDPRVRDPQIQQTVSTHMLTGLAGLVFAALVHAITFTYFMGTGRWIEETSRAYQLPEDQYRQNQSVKYRLLPGICLAFTMLVMTGAFGAMADPATGGSYSGWLGLSPATVHLVFATLTVCVNLAVNLHEFRSIERNGEIVASVMSEVVRIRTERGLPV